MHCLCIDICICTTAEVCLCFRALFRGLVIYDLGYGFHWGHIKLQNSPLLLSSLFSPTCHPSLCFSHSLPLFRFIHHSSMSTPLHLPLICFGPCLIQTGIDNLSGAHQPNQILFHLVVWYITVALSVWLSASRRAVLDFEADADDVAVRT